MSVSPEIECYHREQTAHALELYKSNLSASKGASDWEQFVTSSHQTIETALEGTDFLLAIENALKRSGRSSVLLRYLTTPPKSQAQFEHICKQYSTSAENSGSGITAAKAEAVAAAFDEWRDRSITSWLDQERRPTESEIDQLIRHVTPMMALQKLMTFQRMSASAAQELAVAEMLVDAGWVHQKGRIIDRSIQAYRFMRKARFVADRQTKEVDVAIGLGRTFVLALECKVSTMSRIRKKGSMTSAKRQQRGKRNMAGL